MKKQLNEQYIVKENTAEAPGVRTLKLSREDDTIPSYVPGQYITVYFPELGTPEGKAYSISSAPWEDTLHITVRAMGAFSNRLCAMNPGDRITASEPLGYFYSESTDSTLVMIAAGTGIMPFRSMIVDAVKNNPSRRIKLFYSSRTFHDIVFEKLLDGLWVTHDHFDLQYFITRQDTLPSPIIHSRMNADYILKGVSGCPKPEFLLCGSIPFIRDIWRDLRSKGVPEDSLYTEAFFSH